MMFPTLATVYFYEGNELIHENRMFYAETFAHAARIMDDEYPMAERMDIQMYAEGMLHIPDEKMDAMRQILEDGV